MLCKFTIPPRLIPVFILTFPLRYTEQEVARRLLSQGYVMVGHAKVAVKEMDGQPAIFNN